MNFYAIDVARLSIDSQYLNVTYESGVPQAVFSFVARRSQVVKQYI